MHRFMCSNNNNNEKKSDEKNEKKKKTKKDYYNSVRLVTAAVIHTCMTQTRGQTTMCPCVHMYFCVYMYVCVCVIIYKIFHTTLYSTHTHTYTG